MIPDRERTERAAQVLAILRAHAQMTTPMLARMSGASLAQIRYTLSWLESENDVERCGHDGNATLWRIPAERKVET